jgi:hypothetical protein
MGALGVLKVYLPKAREFSEGEALSVYPTRYLIYREDQPPVEVKRSLENVATGVVS